VRAGDRWRLPEPEREMRKPRHAQLVRQAQWDADVHAWVKALRGAEMMSDLVEVAELMMGGRRAAAALTQRGADDDYATKR
jgi:hypothetical protein